MRLLIVSMICVAGIARADVDGDTAKRLFDEAVDDFAAGRINEACPKLETSIRVRPEIKAMGMLGACYEKQGKLATAWRQFKEVRKKAEAANDNDHAVAAAGHVARLDPKVARVTIVAEKGASVTLSGKPFTELSKPYEIDAGTHKITASAGGKSWDKTITIKDGDNERVEVPKLGAGDATSNPNPTPTPIPTPAPQPAEPGKSSRKLIGIGVLGGGAAIAGVGLFFGAQANKRWGNAQDAGCNDDGDCPTAAGVKLVDEANSKAKLSTVFVGVGLAAIAAGVVIYVTAPKRAERVALTIGGRGLQLVGRF